MNAQDEPRDQNVVFLCFLLSFLGDHEGPKSKNVVKPWVNWNPVEGSGQRNLSVAHTPMHKPDQASHACAHGRRFCVTMGKDCAVILVPKEK